MGGFLAMLAALGHTSREILHRRGLMEENAGNVWEINLITYGISFVLFLIVMLLASLFGFNILDEFSQLTAAAVLLLMLEGSLGLFLGSFFLTTSVAQIGASHSSALWTGSNPLFATILAMVLLGERPDFSGIIAVFMIVIGIVAVGYRGHEGTVKLLGPSKTTGGLFALLSGFFFALSQVARGAAISQGATANTGFFIGGLTSLIVIAAACRLKLGNFNHLRLINKKSMKIYLWSGVATFIGRYSLMAAFTMLPVWQAVAIRNIQPLLAIILAMIFVKEAEKINLRLVIGAILVTAGVVFLNLHAR